MKQYLSQTTEAKSVLFGGEGLIGREWESKSHSVIVESMYLGIRLMQVWIPTPQGSNYVDLDKLLNHSEPQFIYLNNRYKKGIYLMELLQGLIRI